MIHDPGPVGSSASSWHVPGGWVGRRGPTQPVPPVLSLRDRQSILDRWVRQRLERVVPQEMKRHGFDMWLIICNEGVEDPVFRALVPDDPWAVRRLSMLIFFDRGAAGLERILIAHHGKQFYTKDWNEGRETQWEALRRVVHHRQPRRIGINEALKIPFGDGLTAGLKRKLFDALGSDLSSRLHSAEDLAVAVLGRRLPDEIALYHGVVLLTRAIIREAFSRAVISPGITRTSDVQWWMQQKVVDLGLERMSLGSVQLVRHGSPTTTDGVIRPGDALHCDFGLKYLGLYSDLHEWAYVPRHGEAAVPEGLQNAMRKANRMQEILAGEFMAGRTGNQVQRAAIDKGRAEGLVPRVFSHPIGLHVHGAGPFIGTPDRQDPERDLEIEARRGDYPIAIDTAWAIELSVDVAIPEWDGQLIRFDVEQEAFFSEAGVQFIGGRQTEVYLVQ